MGVAFRPLTGAAARLRRQALDLARQVLRGGGLNRIYEVFIVRATGASGNAVATVIETPTYLLGAFGGPNGLSNYYLPVAQVDFGAMLDYLLREDVKQDGGNPVPSVPLDEFKLRIPWGDGRVSVGALPAWGDIRNAVNNSTSVGVSLPSAAMVAVCPSLVEETPDLEDRPWLRSLFVCRANGYMSGSPLIYDGTEDPPVETAPDVPAKHPAINPDVPVGRAERISGLEIAQDLLSLGARDELHYAAQPIEWGPLHGMVPVLVRTLAEASAAVQGNELRFVRYQITDLGADQTPRYSAALNWVLSLGADELPVADRPAALSNVDAADNTFTYPGWAIADTTVAGRTATTGRLRMRDPNVYMRVHSLLAGKAEGATDDCIALVEIQSEVEGASVSVRGYKDNGVDPVSFNTVVVPANPATKWVSYVAKITFDGLLTLTKLVEFVDSRYDTAGSLARKQVQAYGGFTAAGDTPGPRLFCSEWTIPYEVVAAQPDGPPPYLIQGEPAKRVLEQYYNYVALADLEFYMLAGDGTKTPLDFGDYYPMLYENRTGAAGVAPAPTNARTGFGNSAFYDNNPRYANNAPLPICQFAPGMVAVLVAPRTSYTANGQLVRIAVFSVETGELKALGPAVAGVQLPATFTLSCLEQGTVDDRGELTSYGRLLLSVSTSLTNDTRSDGIFVITGLNKLSWVAREPSNIPAVYAGNGLVPADMGVTANLTFVKPTAL